MDYLSTHSGADIDKAITVSKRTLINATISPATNTVGELGQLCLITETGDIFKCTDITDGVYTWEPCNIYTNAEKSKLAGIDDNANNYTHPETHPASIIGQDESHRFVSDTEKDEWNTKYTKQQAVQKFAYLEAATGNSAQITDTIDAPFAELEILGETLATPTDPEQEVSPDNPQTLTSLTSFDYIAENADASETITKSISLKDTSDNQLEARGIPATYNPDGSVATWSGRSRIVKRSDSKWHLEQNAPKYTLQAADITALGTTRTNIDTVAIARTNLTGIVPTTYGATQATLIMQRFRPSTSSSIIDDVQYAGSYINTASVSISILLVVEKGKYASLAAAKADLTGMEIIFAATPTYTELCAADQTALNEIEAAGTFDGITNIMLSTPIGQVYVKAAKDITAVIADMASAIALLG